MVLVIFFVHCQGHVMSPSSGFL